VEGAMMVKTILRLTIVALVMFIICCSFWITRGAGRYQIAGDSEGHVWRIDNSKGSVQSILLAGYTIEGDIDVNKK
jgi:hypothetical protein